ncbi:MAG: serine/threonine protein kinase [Archangiaceae bacterium]|nr:serine/threonine protein kinase [Archangiaceae bacterium]
MSERRFGPFVLKRRLGSGGMAQVWEAVPDEGGAPVALKYMLGDASRSRFLAEMKLSAGLRHPHVVEVFRSGIDEGHPWIAMELLHGATLAELRRRETGPWPAGLVLELARQLLEGLEAVHALGVVHRDVKPSNVFLTRDGTLRLIDLGIALASDGERTRTESGAMVGSVRYASPEQVRGEALDARTDLYAVGLILFELLSGRRAFDQPTDLAVMSALMFLPSPRLAGAAPSVSPELDEVVWGAMQRDPARRPGTARELREQLERVALSPRWSAADVAQWLQRLPEPPADSPSGSTPSLDAEPVNTGTVAPRASALPAPEPAPEPARAVTPRRRRRVAVALSALAVVALAAGGAAVAFRAQPPPPASEAPRLPQAALEPAPEAVEPEAPPPPALPAEAVPEESPAPEPARRSRPDARPSAVRASARPAALGWLTVSVEEGWGNVWVDRRMVGETPLFRVPLSPGAHRVELVRSDSKRQVRSVDVHANRDVRIRFPR